MYPLIATAFTILSLLVGSNNAVTFVLDPGSYPDVTDHHCIAFYCSRLPNFQQSPTGFHRDTNSGGSERSRRHAIGCDGVTDCHTSTTGWSCDEIPYASTFDGGLGCFASDWTNSGRSVNSLYNVGTHRCVNSGHNSATTTCVQLTRNNVQNFQEFTLAFKLPNGCPDPKSAWCATLLNAVRAGQSIVGICASATAQRSHAKVTSSAYTRPPRCPSRNYRRDAEETDAEDEPANNTTTASTSFAELTADMLQVATLDNGVQIMPMLGTHKMGDDVWVHDDTLENGTLSKVVGISSFEEHFSKLGKRQTC